MREEEDEEEEGGGRREDGGGCVRMITTSAAITSVIFKPGHDTQYLVVSRRFRLFCPPASSRHQGGSCRYATYSLRSACWTQNNRACSRDPSPACVADPECGYE